MTLSNPNFARMTAALSGVALITLFGAADWPQFRGTSSNSVSRDTPPPASWGAGENIAWKAELPGRGPSSPIIVGNKVIVTCSSGVKQDRIFGLIIACPLNKRLKAAQRILPMSVHDGVVLSGSIHSTAPNGGRYRN